ncbi:sugar ABC transporter substrate-binding protein [Pseudomonas sp. GX19020]|uniref:sugar ABC transporter substrate-binding protein n=1 Tax=Pseudomonadota TaxID=1224 RepID=UPI00089C9DDB|nr:MULTISPECIES: sugar ABC transporter substrate-binding protein [Pseudomonadota]MCL4066044.1 sugar ABC transporter substrate-binding protein [Pseudomonas sp. GX19020]SEC70855.1 simple sugar transport system substrate-binding protein/ribose transport system substrate-binding protein [Rhodobacter sp. 24-YEA-8]
MNFKDLARRMPDFTNRKVIDAHMERLDTSGVSRRDFLSFASASAAAAAGAAYLGLPATAIASENGKFAYLTGFLINEWNVTFDRTAKKAGEVLGLNYSSFDSSLDGEKQYNQFESQVAASTNGVIFNLADGSAIRGISRVASQNKIYVANVWDSLPWFTPFDADEYYTLFAVSEEVTAHREITEVLLAEVTEKFGGGDIIGVTGSKGSLLELQRNRGRDQAFEKFPKTKLVDELPGLWNREDALKATEDLLTRNPNVVGIVTQDDDIALGSIAALKAAGLRPGEDVLIVGTSGTGLGSKAVKNGEMLATKGNTGAFAAALFTTRIYDVLNGWVPRAPERQLNWNTLTLDQSNIDGWIERYVDNGDVEPFDYKRMSKVLHPEDWDPQNEVYPLDIDNNFAGIDKPQGYEYPAAYVAARENGESAAVAAEYADHYKIKYDGPSPNKA